MLPNYETVVAVLSKKHIERRSEEIRLLEPWFRATYAVFERLSRKALVDVIRHSHVSTFRQGDVIIEQGKEALKFFVIFRGEVSVYNRESTDEDDRSDAAFQWQNNSQLGTVINQLGYGHSFGDQALTSDSGYYTGTVVANEGTDLLVCSRDVYERTVATSAGREYEHKLKFVNALPLLQSWQPRLKAYVAESITTDDYIYDDTLVRQGETADTIFFIQRGEVKLIVEPAAHLRQFPELMQSCERKEETIIQKQRNHEADEEFQKLKNLISMKSHQFARHKCATRKAVTCHEEPTKFALCFLEAGHIVGDVEFLAGLSTYHVTAVCTQNTTVMALSRNHFDRLFVKNNADTVARMRRVVAEQLSARKSRPHLDRQLPLFGCVINHVNQLMSNGLPKTNLIRDDISVRSTASGANWRAKSVVSSARSFPLTSRKKQADRRNGTHASGGQSSREMCSMRPREATKLRFSLSVDRRSLGRRSAGSRNPRSGIFVKLLQVSNSEPGSCPLHIDREEYTYLLQLKRRLAKQMDNFFPHLPGSLDTRENSVVEQRFPKLADQSDKQKDSAQKPASQSGPTSKSKVTMFTLPRV